MVLKVGNELDQEIAEKVMGWTDFWTDGKTVMGYPPREQPVHIGYSERDIVWNFSTDISHAMSVVKKFDYIFLYRDKKQPADFFCKVGQWECKLTWKDGEQYLGVGDSAPEAICRAALLAVNELINDPENQPHQFTD